MKEQAGVGDEGAAPGLASGARFKEQNRSACRERNRPSPARERKRRRTGGVREGTREGERRGGRDVVAVQCTGRPK